MRYQLISKMSGECISTHKTLELAKKAAQKFQSLDCQPDEFRPWRIEFKGEVVEEYGMLEATGYLNGGW